MKINYLNFPKEVSIRKREYLGAINRVLKSGSYILSSEVEGFEKSFAKYLGVKYCVGTANGLEAIQIALMAYGVGKGDEVITTPVSAVATTLSILAVAATPVFVDINENGQIDEKKIENAITKKTKAILPVDLYGQPCELDRIRSLCKKYHLHFIEDACQAHGSEFQKKKLGTFGDVGCFSFYPTKNLGAYGDGGALVTNNTRIANVCREIRDYGQKAKYIHVRFGLNSRLDELQAAILSVKLKHLDNDNNRRKKLAARYAKNLENIEGLKIVLPYRMKDSNFHLFVIKSKMRDKLVRYLLKRGIPSLVHYPLAIPDQLMFIEKYRNLHIPNARNFVEEVLSLPCHPFMKPEEVDYISSNIKKFFLIRNHFC
jgi:dTDP-4-amino-4,6-dideoxygalactose transaminase